MSYAGDERRAGGTVYAKTTKKKPKPKPPAPPKLDFGFLPPIASAGSAPANTFWQNNPIPQGAPLVPTTPGDAVGAILASDPTYQAWLANLNAEGVADRASRDAAIRRSIVMFGEVPNVPPGFLSGADTSTFNSILDPTTRSLASQNTTSGMSIVARLAQAAKDAQRTTVNNLGARGMFRSGETGFQLGRNQLATDQARYDATMKLLDYMAGVQAAFTSAERARAAQAAQAAGQVVQDYDPPPNPAPTYPTSPAPTYAGPAAPPIEAVLKAIFPAKPKPKPPPKYNPPGFIGGV